MSNVIFIFKKADESLIELEYKSLDVEHARSWYTCIKDYVNSGVKLTDSDRVYNFNKYVPKNFNKEIAIAINNCNDTIKNINTFYNNNIPIIYKETLQSNVNYVHTFFVEADRTNDTLSEYEQELWSNLNTQLHGLEIFARSQGKKFRGTAFVQLPNTTTYDLSTESLRHFTVTSKFGVCYSNYPQVGRHIHELFSANDSVAADTHILPQSKISGDSFLWFGNNSSWCYSQYEIFLIKRWFIKNNIEEKLNMKWGDPKLAIGKLPVANIVTRISKQDLYGIVKLVDIAIR